VKPGECGAIKECKPHWLSDECFSVV